MAQADRVIPLDPPWADVVARLHRHYGSFDKLLDAMGAQGCTPCDHSTLCKLQSGKNKRPSWRAGAALLNLYGMLKG